MSNNITYNFFLCEFYCKTYYVSAKGLKKEKWRILKNWTRNILTMQSRLSECLKNRKQKKWPSQDSIGNLRRSTLLTKGETKCLCVCNLHWKWKSLRCILVVAVALQYLMRFFEASHAKSCFSVVYIYVHVCVCDHILIS